MKKENNSKEMGEQKNERNKMVHKAKKYTQLAICSRLMGVLVLVLLGMLYLITKAESCVNAAIIILLGFGIFSFACIFKAMQYRDKLKKYAEDVKRGYKLKD